MSVTNYTPEKCRYWIGKLDKAVYLVSDEAIKDIRIDNGEAWVNSISESPIKLDCYNINLSEEESLDERYKFVHTLTFSVNGYANKDDFQGKYYVIVKDFDGTWWLVNPLFPCKVTYTYTLGYQQNHTDFSIGTASNYPILKLNGMSDSSTYECQDYWLDGIDKLWLNEKKYTVHDEGSIKYTNDGFKDIKYNKSSAVFTENFDGENVKHQIDFDVLFSDYKSSWHYNLLEFKDNLYAAIIKTTDGKYALCGFSFGLQPGYTVSADDTVTTGNKIQITLQDVHDVGDTIEMYDSINPIQISSSTWEYTSEYDGYECVGDGVAKYLLQKEVDALGNETGNYKALTGYENNFPELNITGTFSSVVMFARSECLVEPCRLSTSIPSSILFTEVGSKTYTLRAGSEWSITHDQGITVSPESGNANTDYIVTVYNPHTPTADDWITSLKVSYCSGQEYDSVITVKIDEDSCFMNGSMYNVSANAQTIKIPTKCCIENARESTDIGVDVVIHESYLNVTIPENNTGYYRTIIVVTTLCDGNGANIVINQSNIYEKWENYGEPFCDGKDLYQEQYLWTGTTSVIYHITTTHRNVLVEENSSECGQIRYKWVKSNETICVYYGDDMFRWISSGFTCIGYDLYENNIKQVSHNGGISWENVVPQETSASTLIEENSTECGFIPPLVDQYFTIVPRSNGIIKKGGKDDVFQYSIDSGNTWVDATSGTNISMTTGNKIMFRGTTTPDAYHGIGRFSASTDAQFDVEGNIMSLLFGSNFSGQTSLDGTSYTFLFLFGGCSGLIDSARLSLPATTLARDCYNQMFKNCTSLVTVPQLPATNLARGCYYRMFNGCTNITISPYLPATYLLNQCYYGMFGGCTHLSTIKCNATSRNQVQCITGWVDNVSENGTFFKNSNTTWSDGIPTGWEIKNLT